MLCCPFHADKTPSMQVYPETNTVFCFSSNCELSGASFFGQSSGDTPAAYLNYLFFDNNYNQTSAGFKQILDGASNEFTKLAISFPVPEEGYIFIYLSNETSLDANVYFDDFKITHTSSASVLQADPTHRLATR